MDEQKGLPNEQLEWIDKFLSKLESDGYFTEALSNDIVSQWQS